MAYKKKTKKQKKNVGSAIVHVKSSFNNTLVTITTMEGDVLFNCSAGEFYKGSKKGTPFAASQALSLKNIFKSMSDVGIRNVEINFKGPGPGRDSIARAFQASDFAVNVLRDVTPLPHNGPRPPKKRRV